MNSNAIVGIYFDGAIRSKEKLVFTGLEFLLSGLLGIRKRMLERRGWRK